MSKLKKWPTYTLLASFVMTGLVFASFSYVYIKNHPETIAQKENTATVANVRAKDLTKDDPWQVVYPDTKDIKIKDVTVQASLAKTWPERIRGLSDTPYLPENVVKFFVFDTPGLHSIWMKDMKYSIDILWVTKDGKIIHIEEEATPESYPDTFFVPQEPALYVIETLAGFVSRHNIILGDQVELTNLHL